METSFRIVKEVFSNKEIFINIYLLKSTSSSEQGPVKNTKIT